MIALMRTRGRYLAFAVAAAWAAACARTPINRGPAVPVQAATGYASYYSDALKGRKTASGEPYDPERLTCAHRTLALGTDVRVTVKSSGRSEICRVNDRGPYVHGRIIDVSRAMAKRLGMGAAGVVEVEIRPVD